MNNRVNYSVIGFLVLFSLSMMIGFGYWLLKPADNLEMQKYVIYFDESVLGLNLDAPVKYRGISVGKVARLRINPKNSEQVEVLVNVLKTTPIKSSTVAKLTSQGITGLSYINLSLGDNNSPALKAKNGEEFPVIKTTPSLLIKLEKTFGDVSTNLSTTLERTNQLLNKDNQKEIALLLKNSSILVQKFNQTLDEETIINFHETMKNLNSSTQKFDEMMPSLSRLIDKSSVWEDEMSASFNSIMNSYLGIKSSMEMFKQALASGDFNIKEISNDIIPTVNDTLVEMQELMIKMQEAINQHERSPGDLIFSQEKIKKGPGED